MKRSFLAGVSRLAGVSAGSVPCARTRACALCVRGRRACSACIVGPRRPIRRSRAPVASSARVWPMSDIPRSLPLTCDDGRRRSRTDAGGHREPGRRGRTKRTRTKRKSAGPRWLLHIVGAVCARAASPSSATSERPTRFGPHPLGQPRACWLRTDQPDSVEVRACGAVAAWPTERPPCTDRLTWRARARRPPASPRPRVRRRRRCHRRRHV